MQNSMVRNKTVITGYEIISPLLKDENKIDYMCK